MKLVLPILIIVIYWCLDAYQAVTNFNISFTKAILLDYENSQPLMKLIIVASIFIFSIMQTKNKTKSQQDDSITKELNALYSISNIILSPLPFHKQLNNVVDIIESELKIKTAFIASFENDKILILNTNESLNKIGIKNKYMPHQNELNENSIEKLLSITYLEKREKNEDTVKINGINYKVILQTYKENNLKISMGIVVILLEKNDKNDYKNFLKKVCEQVSFTVNLTRKKEEAIQAQNRHNAQFSPIDKELNIPSNSKLQEMIEYEIKRSQRYGTQLSIMLIEVDHMRNLSNIFSQKDTGMLKKEFTALFKRNIRETDMLGKWGDHHFAIVAPNISHRATKNFAHKLNQKLSEHRFSKVGKITCSYGITSFSPKDTIGEFRKRAENALKEATSKGGNTIEIKILV
jgi:diguanylate cyclase (GGDEF)-like protein